VTDKSFTKSDEYINAIKKEGEHWGLMTEDALKYGIPHRVDFRLRTKIRRPLNQGEYEDDPVLFDIVMGDEIQKLMQSVIRYSSTGKKVLELACGPGGIALELARNGLDVTAIDVSEKSINIAKQFLERNQYTDTFGRVNYIVADLNVVSIAELCKKEKFDVVYSNGGLHHILEIEALSEQINNVLRNDGYFIFYDNIGETQLYRILEAVMNYLKKTGTKNYISILSGIYTAAMQSIKNHNNQMSESKYDEVVKIKTCSPFEAITTHDMLDCMKKHFSILKEYHCQAFAKIIAHNIYWANKNNWMTYILIYVLKQIDKMLCYSKMSKGGNVLVVARKMS